MASSVQRINELIKALSGVKSESTEVNTALTRIVKSLTDVGSAIHEVETATSLEEVAAQATITENGLKKLAGALVTLQERGGSSFDILTKSIRDFGNEIAITFDKLAQAGAAGADVPLRYNQQWKAEGRGLRKANVGINANQVQEQISRLLQEQQLQALSAPVIPQVKPVLYPDAQPGQTIEPGDPQGVLQGGGLWADAKRQRIDVLKEYIATLEQSKVAQKEADTVNVTSADILRELDLLNTSLATSVQQRAAASQQAVTAINQETVAEQQLIDALKQEVAEKTKKYTQLHAQGGGGPVTGLGNRDVGGGFLPGTDEVKVVRGNMEDIQRVLSSGAVLTRRVRDVQKELTEEWKRAGIELSEFKVEVDAASNSLKVYADAKAQGATVGGYTPEIGGAGIASQTVDIMSGQIIDPAVQVQRVLQDMGAGATAFKKIEDAVRKAGFAMNDFKRDFGETNDGMRKLQFESVGATGAISRHNVVLDKSGNIIDTVKSKYESLTSAIGNNVNKVLRWGIAVGLIYGTLNKVRDAISEMITMQDALADVQIVTGRGAENLAADLSAVADAAAETGITLGEAVGVYRQALQAAGRYSTESERLSKAQTLVADSLILARLGGIDTAKALDSLVGALRQSNLEMDQGRQLLDSWVATSKAAKVSLEDLSESFAITAAQASAVGVNTDELNGIIGTIAEVTTLSSTEIGNLGRTLLSSFESGEAVASLREHGIVVKDVAGEYRDWNDVMQDISGLYAAGAISEKELSTIGRALGGGARRGPQVVAFIKEYSRVNELAAASADANGDAAGALDIKMDTLSNSVKKLQVALSQLAQTAGAEGGVLSFLTDLTNIITGLVSPIDAFTSSLGEMVAVVTALGVATVGLNKLDAVGRLGSTRLGKGVTSGIAGYGVPTQSSHAADLGLQVGTGTGQKFLNVAKAGAPVLGAAVAGGVLTGLQTGSAIEGVGAAIGGGIGMYLGGPAGALIGTVIGQKIGSVFQDELDREASREKIKAGEVTELDQIISAIRTEAAGSIGARYELPTDISDPEKLSTALEEWIATVSQKNEEYADAVGENFNVLKARESISVIEDLNEALKRNIAATEESTVAKEQENEFAVRRAGIRQEYEPGLDAALDAARTEMITKLGASEISRSDYTRFQQNREISPGITTNIFDLLEPELDQFGGKSQKTFEELGVELATALDPRALEYFQDRLSEIAALRTAINDIKNDTTSTISQLSYAAQLESQLASERRVVAQELNAMIEEAKASLEEIHTPSFTRRPEELTPDIAQQAMEVAKANQEMYAVMNNIDPEKFAQQADAFIELWEADDRLRELTGVHKLFWDDAVGLALAAAQEIEDAQSQFSVRRLQDVDPSQFGEIQAKNRYWVEYLARMRGQSAEQYLGDEGYEENLILGPNNVWQKLLTTSEAMSFTLQDILETEKKQLEGQWNIPEGATFWVPLTSLFYQNQNDGGVPALPPIDEALLDEIKSLKDALAGAGRFAGYEQPTGDEAIDSSRAQAAQDRKDAEERALNLEDAPGALATRQGNTLIDSLDAIVANAKDPNVALQTMLSAIQNIEKFGLTEEGTFDTSKITTLAEVISAGISSSMVPALSASFQDAFASPLDTPREYDLVEEAITQLLDVYKPEDVSGRGSADVGDVLTTPIGLLNTAVNAMKTFVEQPPVIIKPEIGDVTRAIEIVNTLNLDGSVLKRWLDTYLATETNRLSRSQGNGGAP